VGCRRFQNFYYLYIEIFSEYSHNIGITDSKFYDFLTQRKHVVQEKWADSWRKFLSDELHNSSPQNISNFMISTKMTWVDQITVMRDFRLLTWPRLATLEEGSCLKKYDQYLRLQLQFCVLLMMGVFDTRKNVEWTCRIINRLLCVPSRWTIINIDQRCKEP